MSSTVPRPPSPGLFRSIIRATDWRLVAAIGLPVWAFVIGVVVAHKPAPAAPAPQPVEVAVVPATPPAPETNNTIPPPREVVVRTEYQPIPILVPITPPGEPGAPPVAAPPAPAPEPPAPPVVVALPVEFKLPASEVMPADRCKTFDTKIRFHPDLASAAEDAKQSKKMILVLHISGNFDDPGFT